MFMQALSIAFLVATVHSKPSESIHENSMQITLTKTGPCYSSDGQTIQRGQWKPTDGCSQNCTCDPEGFLACQPWCQLHLKMCRTDEVQSKTSYFEEIGKTGCKRCIIESCDAIEPAQWNKVEYRETHRERNFPFSNEAFHISKTTETVYERVKPEEDDKSHL